MSTVSHQSSNEVNVKTGPSDQKGPFEIHGSTSGLSTNNNSSRESGESSKKLSNGDQESKRKRKLSGDRHNSNSAKPGPKNDSKKPSFFNSDDSDASSNPNDSPQPYDCNPKRRRLIHENHNGFKSRMNSDLSKAIKPRKIIEESHRDDASSTSSCSCDDHKSLAGHSDDLHEDLDYDEDSITHSPPRNQKIITTPSREAHDSTVRTPPQRAPKIKSSSPVSSSKHEQKCLPLHKKNGPSCETDQRNVAGASGSRNRRSRIKSVINYDRGEGETNNNLVSEPNQDKNTDDKSQKSYDNLLKYFFKDACYFQIKSINHENVELSKSMGVWSTPVHNEVRLNQAFRDHRNVILIFSVQQSGAFQGFARMISESRPSTRTIPWVLPARLSQNSLGGVLKVEWLCTTELPFHATHDLFNPFNGNKPVKVARDGQQVEPHIGKRLCRLFPEDSKDRLLSCLTTLKQQASDRKRFMNRPGSFYPLADRRDYGEDYYRPPYFPPHELERMNDPFGPPQGPSPFHDYMHHPYNMHPNHIRPPPGWRRDYGPPHPAFMPMYSRDRHY